MTPTTKVSIKDCLYYAKHNRGKFLSKSVDSIYELLEWQCEKGHRWQKSYYYIEKGKWCPQCLKQNSKEYYFARYQQIAKEHGGICLSKRYIDSNTKLEFKCSQGHVFSSVPNEIYKGRWCTSCRGGSKRTLEFYQNIAEKNGGTILSKKYIGSTYKLKWQCKEGHVFSTTPMVVHLRNVWCPDCKRIRRRADGSAFKHTIIDMQKLAKSKHGKCLSKKYQGVHTILKWVCQENHVFETEAHNVLQGSWCPKCVIAKHKIKLRTTYKFYQNLVSSKGAKLITTKKEYDDFHDKLTIVCKFGHQWTTRHSNIKSGAWCHECRFITSANKRRLPFEVYIKAAKARGGKLLSTEAECLNSLSKLRWQCDQGHEWKAIGYSVIKGTWCQKCYLEKIQKKIE
ncbi:MAG: hypothetical protein IPP71_08000 [Bacteroidetes bacterium]|nr:hypothetical protein [Bacteroidota bacterium]